MKASSTRLVVTGVAVGGVAALFIARSRRRRAVLAVPQAASPGITPHPTAEKARQPRPMATAAAWRDHSPRHLGSYQREPLMLSRDAQVTARPHPHSYGRSLGDDAAAIDTDELGTAFLARATETSSQDTDDDELRGLGEGYMVDESRTREASDKDVDQEPGRPFDDDRRLAAGEGLDEALADIFDHNWPSGR